MRPRIAGPFFMRRTPPGPARLVLLRAAGQWTREHAVMDPARGGQVSRAPAFESGAGGLVATIDDMAAFGRMLLGRGALGGERILARSTVELMTMDHLTPAQKTASVFFPDFWEDTGWWVDPVNELVCVLMTQRRPDVLAIPPLTRDFATSVYQLID